MAKATKEQIGYTGGRESALSDLGAFFLWVGIIGFIAAVISAGFATREELHESWAENGFSGLWITVGIVSLVQGIAANVFCKAFADILRLLKKQNGVPYGGEISTAKPLYVYTCSECGADGPPWVVDVKSDKCEKCGAAFEHSPAEAPIPGA